MNNDDFSFDGYMFEGPKKNRRKDKGRGSIAITIAVCMICSFVFGLGGGVLAFNYAVKTHGTQAEGSAAAETAIPVVPTPASTAAAAGSPIKTTSGREEATLTYKEIVNEAADSVVEIATQAIYNSYFSQQSIYTGAGSGVIVSQDGYIVTNNHVVSGASTIAVRTKDGESYEAMLVATDADTDLALLKIEASGLKPIVFGDSGALEVGDVVVAIGNPLGTLGGTVTQGIISALDRDLTIDGEKMTLLQTDASVSPGNSGGALVNDRGELVGIVNAKSSMTGVEGIGFAIPSNHVKEIIDQLLQHGYVTGRVFLGIMPLEISSQQHAMMYGVKEIGLYVYAVVEGSGAEAAGLQQGDLIRSINGQTLTTADELNTVLEGCSVGDIVSIVVERKGREVVVQATLGEKVPEGYGANTLAPKEKA